MKNILLGAGAMLFAALPGTANYTLNSFTFGSGGTANSSTATYSLEGSAGSLAGADGSTVTYGVKPGYTSTQLGNVPTIATLDNNGGTYQDKLHFVIGTASNPTDAKYAISISTDNFASDIRYVKNDLTVSGSLTTADYQTYTTWGGATGANITGLTSSTLYYVRAKVTQGKYTETGFGPANSTSTGGSSISFSVTTSTQSNPPFSINFGQLLAGTIMSSPQTINVGLSTSAANGANIYIAGKNNGLKSTSTNATIAAVSNDLASLGSGYGAQSSSVSQTSGGPISAVSPYNGTSGNVGTVDTTLRSIYTSSAAITGGTASLTLKAKSATTSVAASDYSDTVTLVAAGSF